MPLASCTCTGLPTSPGPSPPPGHQIAQVAGHQGVHEFRRAGYAQGIHVPEQDPGHAQAAGHVAAAVPVRVVDEASPVRAADGIFDVGSHQDHEIACQALGELSQPRGVLQRERGVMERAGPDDHRQAPVILAVQQVPQRAPALLDDRGCASRGLDAPAQGFGGGQGFDVAESLPRSALECFSHVFLRFLVEFRNEKTPGLTPGLLDELA